VPRKSAESLATSSSVVDLSRQRLHSPADLPPPAREVFLDLVASVSARHFAKGDIPLLASYSRAIVMHRQACEALESEGQVVSGRPSVWCAIWERQVKAMCALARSLRLTVQSRVDARAAGRHTDPHQPSGIDWGAK
jgi:phage terminase small subunit